MNFDKDQWQAWTGLMKQTQKGDRDAYEKLLVEISPLILGFVRKRVFNPQQVEDIFQEVFLTFHKAKHTYRSELPFGPWFFAVTRNAIWDALQRNRKFAEHEVAVEEFHDARAQEAADGGVDDRLHLALESLPVGNRQAVELLKFKGMSLQTAAKEMGISVAAVKVRAHRGYNLLRNYLTSRQEKRK